MKWLWALIIGSQAMLLQAQDMQPLSPGMESYNYPYRVRFYPLNIGGQDLRMAYMDIAPAGKSNGETVLLLHGKNFGSYYWQPVIAWLSAAGYRIIAPDQIGFGRSSKPDIHYTFHLLAANTHALLDSLGVKEIIVMGHSTGGMLAARYALTYPEQVTRLIMEDPIGLEDYRLLVPYDSIQDLYGEELHKSDEETTKYIKAYFYEWKPQYQEYADVMNRWKRSGEFPRQAMSAALTTQMIYEQPVCYEYNNITCPTLIIVGADDRTVVEKGKVPKSLLAQAGRFPELAKKTAGEMPHGSYKIIARCGHLPMIEQPDAFKQAVLEFLNQ